MCQDAAIAIVKTGVINDTNGNDCADADVDTVSYTFTVTNEGNVSITDVTVTDPLLGGLLTAVPTGDTDGDSELDVTETWVYTQDYTISQDDIDLGTITNQATVNGTSPTGDVSDISDESLTTEDDPTVTTLCQDAAIAIVKTGVFNDNDGDDCADIGEVINYTFTVTNEGNVTLSDIEVIDLLLGPDPVIGPVSGDLNGDMLLDLDEIWVYTANYVFIQADIDAGEVINQATATGSYNGGEVNDLSDESLTTEDDPTITTLCQNDSIAIIKTGVFNDADGDKCADVKETITYSFSVINNGNTTISNITVNDILVNVQGGPITLLPGEEDTTTFTATYLITQADINMGSVTNQAEVIGFNPSGDQVSDLSDESLYTEDDPTVTMLCNESVIALIKTGTPGDENGNGCIDLGETIVYDFVVTNLGNTTLTQVIVTDFMVEVQGGPVTILAGDSDTETFSAVYTVIQADIDNGFVSNQAIAEGIDPMGVVVNDLSDDNSNFEDDPTVSVLCQDASMSLEKTGVFNDENGNLISDPGETISYAFIVTNTGNVTLFNITIDDPLPGIVISGGPIAELAPGEVDDTTFTAVYTITQADIDEGEVINQATATGETGDGEEVTDTSDDPNNLIDTDINGDGDPDDPTITLLPNVLAPFEIFNAVSPDGNGKNDFFLIQGISEYPDNNVKIFNRWGVQVFETNGYGGSSDAENVFTGESQGRETIAQDKLLPTGTYYYVITFNGPNNPGQDSYAGYLYLNR